MNQNFSSPPPILAPSSELGALLFAALPCIHETYRPLASFAFHMAELSRLKSLPAMPPLSNLNNIDSLIADKETLFRSLSFYGNLFHMPILSTIANLLQAMQFYKVYKDILPGLFSAMGGNNAPADSTAGLFSGLGGLSPDLFSALGGLSPELLSSLLSGFSSPPAGTPSAGPPSETTSAETTPAGIPFTGATSSGMSSETPSQETTSPVIPSGTSFTETPSGTSFAETAPAGASYDLYDSLYSLLTPEQKEIYDQLMHTD